MLPRHRGPRPTATPPAAGRQARAVAGAVVALAVVVWLGQASGSRLPPARVALGPHDTVASQWVRGEPVWVVNDEREVRVLAARNPHQWYGLTELVGWCASSEMFISYWDGSQFDRRGRHASGPAPHDLDRYELLPRTPQEVAVGRRFSPRGRSTGEQAPPSARQCLVDGGGDAPLARYHVTRELGYEVLRGLVLLRDGEEGRFCPAADRLDATSCGGEGLRVPQAEKDLGVPAIAVDGRFMARRQGDVLTDMIILPVGTVTTGASG